MRDQVREESRSLDRELKSTVAETQKSAGDAKTPLIEKPASRRTPRAKPAATSGPSVPDDAPAPDSTGDTPAADVAQALGAGKVVRMQPRSTKRTLPVRPPDDTKTNKNT